METLCAVGSSRTAATPGAERRKTAWSLVPSGCFARGEDTTPTPTFSILPVAGEADERPWSKAMIGLHEDSADPAPPPPPAHAPRLAARIFAEGGVLAEVLKLEHRPQ